VQQASSKFSPMNTNNNQPINLLESPDQHMLLGLGNFQKQQHASLNNDALNISTSSNMRYCNNNF
jgi:hypothetical protein